MEMRYFWLLDQKNNRYIRVWYKPGAENMGDSPSKAHSGAIHTHVRPYYIHMENSPTELVRAAPPSARRGCVGLPGDTYTKGVPLPRIPSYRAPVRDSHLPRTAMAASVWPCATASVPRVAPTTRLSLIKCAIRHLHRRLITI